jgi:hypothetical protein
VVNAEENFGITVEAILRRYCTQNAIPTPSAATSHAVASNLWRLIEARGLPPPLAPDENGKPGDLPDVVCSPLVAVALFDISTADREILAVPVRQLVKACFHPEFKVCRDSFREVSPDGTCRRQQLSRVRARISGTHCIDCPHWVALAPEEHARFLQEEWLPSGCVELANNPEIFLPEDFRRLRHLLYAEARRRI